MKNNFQEINHHKLVIKSLSESIKALDKAEEMLDQQIRLYKKEKFKFNLRKCEDAKTTILSLINSLAKDINYRRGTIESLEEEDSLQTNFFDPSAIVSELLGDEEEDNGTT
jgi:hypothetical protein